MVNTTDAKGSIRRNLIGNALIFSATIFFGINIPVTKILIPEWLSAVEVVACRYIGGAVLIWLTSLFMKSVKIDKADWKPIILAGIALFGFLYLFSLAFNYASAIDISIIMILPPIIVVAINAIFKRSKIGPLEWVGVGISFVGAAVLILLRGGASQGSDNLLGELLALGSAVCYAVYLIIIEKPSHKYPSMILMRWVLGISAVLCLPFIGGFAHSKLFMHPEAWPIGLVCFIILLPTYYAYVATPPAVKMIGSEIVSMYQYLVPVIATIAAIIMKVDTLVWYQPVSMAIIIVGVVLADYSKRKIKEKTTQGTVSKG